MQSRRFAWFAVALALAMAALAVGQAAPTSAANDYPEVTVKATEYSFDMPDSINSGYVKITLQDVGKEEHQVQFARINDGKTLDDVMNVLKQGNPDAMFPLVTFTGGANTVEPGASQSVILDLKSGQYLALCFVAGPDGVPHIAKGMVKPFQVTETTSGDQTEPQADATVTLEDFKFELPADFPSGAHTIKVTNNGPESHEFAIMKLADGVSASQVEAMLTAPPPATPMAGAAASPAVASPAAAPPFTAAGGMGALAPGTSGWLLTDLQPGNYVAVCFVPDPKTGKPHVDLGMIAGFTVK